MPTRRPPSRHPRRWRGRVLRATALGAVAVLAALVGSGLWVRLGAHDRVFDAASVPPAAVGIVLGAQVNADGSPSAFLAARLALAKRLYDTGKVRALLVSGDHGRWEYDEPGAMRDWLVAAGVPAERVVLDHAGFDTYDSCVRARRVFGVTEAVVVTQSFHVARAVTLCRHAGIRAVGVGDDSVRGYREPWRRGALREYPAAVKAAWDALSAREPVHLGPVEPGVAEALRAG
ncbi:MAG TPA: ElyC/SanA/YdcF family protein [Pilimelia sp.]|nr:ElyC/SanA/YdcF family protein [Pilimelia sp.]